MYSLRKHPREEGFALVFGLLLLVLISAGVVGATLIALTDTKVGGNDLYQMRAYYGAEAAMEKMMADLSQLYVNRMAPSVEDIQGLTNQPPDLDHISYVDYRIEVPNLAGVPTYEVRNIGAGPNEGLVASIIPMELDVTAQGPLRTEVRMQRDIEVALIPVFQFGIFSDSDLSYFPGPGFDFAGRVHTNGNLFLSTRSSLTFHAKVSAVGEIIRAELANGVSTSAGGRTGPVYIPTAPAGCDGSRPACRNLALTEGSKVAGPNSADNPNWTNISTSIYHGMVVNGRTGARELELPFVEGDLRSIEIIKRPSLDESGTLLSDSRLFSQAQILVLLNDRAEELPGGAGIRLANVEPYYSGGTYGGADTAFAEGKQSEDAHQVPPAGLPAGSAWPLIDGYLLVLSRQADGRMADVTLEWLGLGIARENPDAILKFQTLKDNDGDGTPNYSYTQATRRNPYRWMPINLYDAREGEVRDVSLGAGNDSVAIGGVFNVVELDVGNLRRWLTGAIGTTGTLTESTSQNGYIFYFSDQRGSVPGPDGRLGSYGFEDVVNDSSPAGTPDGVLGPGEDVNENGMLDNWGVVTLGDGFLTQAQGGLTAYDSPLTRIPGRTVARKNRVTGPRHGLKLVNGAMGKLPTNANGGGFTVASENPVYVVGDYNADNGFLDGYAPASIVADAVTVLSKAWADWKSFRDATYVGGGSSRAAQTSWYRMAVAAGKPRNFPNPAWAGSDEYGLDGGTHNFLRYLENWGGQTLHYRGSLVSLFYSEYATGIYKCCATTYSPPNRDYAFETDFLDPANLPPGTPRFRDLVNLGFRQILTSE